MITISIWIVMLIIAYLLGSLSSAIIVCRLLDLPDPRTEGSRNPGATNVLRIGGTKAGMTVLAFDFLKGLFAVLLAKLFHVSGFGLGTVALAVALGHMYPIFFKFEGGKGVATAAGAIFGLSILLGLTSVVIWFVILVIWRYVSLASIVSAVAAPLLSLAFGGISYTLPLVALSLLIVYRHLENVQRLFDGKERKFVFNHPKPAE